jgi:hypothetical protein
MVEINANSGFDSRQCIAKNLDQVLANQIQAAQLCATQKLFSAWINTRALNESVRQQSVDLAAGEDARDCKRKELNGGQPDAQQQPKEQERGGGSMAIIGNWQAPRPNLQRAHSHRPLSI